MNQRQRTRTLGMLQKRQLQILVATDVAARGIDVQSISHAINYDLPMQPEDYTHRIGRTGRAGHSGLAFTLAVHSERHKIRRIEHFIGQPIPIQVIEGLEPKKTARPSSSDRADTGGKRFGGNSRSFGANGRSSFGGGKPSFGHKPGFAGGKPAFGHKPGSDRPESGDRRSSFSNRNEGSDHKSGGDRPDFGARKSFAGRGEERSNSFSDRSDRRSDRPSFDKKPTTSARPASGDRPARASRGDFSRKSVSKPARRTPHNTGSFLRSTHRFRWQAKGDGRHGDEAA